MWINDAHCRQAAEMLSCLLAELPGLDSGDLGRDPQAALQRYLPKGRAHLSPGQRRVLEAFAQLSPDAFADVYATYRHAVRPH